MLLLCEETGRRGPDRLFNYHQGTYAVVKELAVVMLTAAWCFSWLWGMQASSRAVMGVQLCGRQVSDCPVKQSESVLYQELTLQEKFFPTRSLAPFWHRVVP